MKALADHVIIYDADCPMCRVYTGAFVTKGLLDKNGREPYQAMSPAICPVIDKERARNEIALVNRRSGEVIYGLQSLLRILSNAYPLLKLAFSFKPLIALLEILYGFVSYNRKVIMPAKTNSHTLMTCEPDFKWSYRIAYLAAVWLFTSFTLYKYSFLLTALLPASNLYREFLICGGQVAFQTCTLALFKRNHKMNYLGNMMTVSLAGALLLWPAIGIATWLPHQSWFFAGWFMVVVGLMLFGHMRRANILQLGWWISASWVVYRVIILFIIL